jgi:sugar phosphate isomerase/epimerase
MPPDFPFRLGSTSYVYPADLAGNAARLAAAGLIRDMELVLFDQPDGPSNLPDADTVAALADTAARYDLTYTVHLLDDLQAGANGRHSSLDRAAQVIDLTRDLPPHAVIAHVDGRTVDAPGWADQAVRAVQAVADRLPDPALLAVENLENYDPAALNPVWSACPVQSTLDIGHLWKAGRDPLPVMADWLPRTRVVHLHGFDASTGRDHISLAVMPPAQLDPVIAALRDYRGVLTLEVFEDDFFTSRDALVAAWERVAMAGGSDD